MLRRKSLVATGVGAVMAVLSAFVVGAASADRRPVVVARTISTSATGPVVVAIGDSIMAGHGLSPDQAWAALVAKEDGWRFTNLASDGSGFAQVGNNGDTFATQAKAAVELNPAVIIVAGSSNDLGINTVILAQTTSATIASIHAALPRTTIIAVDATWGASALPQQMNIIDDQVEDAVSAAGGDFLDIGQPLSGHPELMQGGDVHPNAAGQRALADAFDQALLARRITV
ncbi:MAG: acyl-CoA thioesterase [Microbacteriaceae bacterium]|nr:acyl-CoA thioesterase [Microbacteriaceae bacterium]